MTPKQTAPVPESTEPSLTDRLAHLDREKFARNMLPADGLIDAYLARIAARPALARAQVKDRG